MLNFPTGINKVYLILNAAHGIKKRTDMNFCLRVVCNKAIIVSCPFRCIKYSVNNSTVAYSYPENQGRDYPESLISWDFVLISWNLQG